MPSIAATPAAATAASSSSSPSPLPAGVGLDIDDYLQGLTALPKELCRLCVNCVRVGNYSMPTLISTFISDLYSGFRYEHTKRKLHMALSLGSSRSSLTKPCFVRCAVLCRSSDVLSILTKKDCSTCATMH